MEGADEAAADVDGADAAERQASGPLTVRDHQLTYDTLKADRLITVLHGDDPDEQRAADEELRHRKLRDVARAEAAVSARRSGVVNDISWERAKPHNFGREP